jgi:hypothetical protein
MLETSNASVERNAAAGAPARYQANVINFTGGASNATYAQAISSSNIVGDYVKDNIGSTIALLEGEAVRGQTEDLSTGGSVTFRLSIKGTEFNA